MPLQAPSARAFQKTMEDCDSKVNSLINQLLAEHYTQQEPSLDGAPTAAGDQPLQQRQQLQSQSQPQPPSAGADLASSTKISTIKDKLALYKRLLVEKEADLARVTDELVDVRAEYHVHKDNTDTMLREMKESFTAQTARVLEKQTAIVQKLMADREDLAAKCEGLAADLAGSRQAAVGAAAAASENEALRAANSRLLKELSALKASFEAEVQQARQKAAAQEKGRREAAVRKAVQDAEQSLAARLEPQLQAMVGQAQRERQAQAAEHEAALARLRSELALKHEADVQEQRAALVQEQRRLLDAAEQDHQAVLVGLRRQHNADLEAAALQARRRTALDRQLAQDEAAQALRAELSAKAHEAEDLRTRLGEVCVQHKARLDKLKVGYLSGMDRLRHRYEAEVANIRQQYRELAVKLWSSHKAEAFDVLRRERDALVQRLAESWDERLEVERRSHADAAQGLDARVCELQDRARASLVDAEALRNDVRIRDISIANLRRELAQSTDTRYAHLARLHLQVEEALSRMVRERQHAKRAEESVLAGVQARIQDVLRAKDATIEGLHRELNASRSQCMQLNAQLAAIDTEL